MSEAMTAEDYSEMAALWIGRAGLAKTRVRATRCIKPDVAGNAQRVRAQCLAQARYAKRQARAIRMEGNYFFPAR